MNNRDTNFQAFVNYENSGLGLAEISHRYAKNYLMPNRTVSSLRLFSRREILTS